MSKINSGKIYATFVGPKPKYIMNITGTAGIVDKPRPTLLLRLKNKIKRIWRK